MQERCNSTANALELHLSCTIPPKCRSYIRHWTHKGQPICSEPVPLLRALAMEITLADAWVLDCDSWGWQPTWAQTFWVAHCTYISWASELCRVYWEGLWDVYHVNEMVHFFTCLWKMIDITKYSSWEINPGFKCILHCNTLITIFTKLPAIDTYLTHAGKI